MKLVAASILLGAVLVSVVAIVLAHQHGHHCKKQGFVTQC